MSLGQDRSSSCCQPHSWASHREKMCPRVSTAAIAWLVRLTCDAGRIVQKSCGMQVRGRVPSHVNCLLDVTLKKCLLTREGGSETGSKEKFSMRFACTRDCCRVEDRLRSSCSACGLNGSFDVSPAPVRPVTCWRAPSGSISWFTSLKRTDCGGVSVTGDAMMGF